MSADFLFPVSRWTCRYGVLLAALAMGLPLLHAKPTARELYNSGAVELQKGNFREAEGWLRKAVEANEEAMQSPALYNLGHVRFQQGRETLRGETSRRQMIQNADAAEVVAEEAFRQGSGALESDDLHEIIQAYMQGRAARKQLRFASEEMNRSLKLYAAVIERWRRSAGDFYSAKELDVSNNDAAFNAEVVEKHLRELLKFKKQLEIQAEQTSGQREQLKKLMSELRKKIPKEMQRQSDDEEEDEDEEGQEPQPGTPQEQRIGGERDISPDMAEWLKETMKQRKMSVEEGKDPEKRKARKGRDW